MANHQKRVVFKSVSTLLVVLVIAHTVFQILLYKSHLPTIVRFIELQNLNPTEVIFYSGIAVVIEWCLIVLMFISNFIKNKIQEKEKTEPVKTEIKNKEPVKEKTEEIKHFKAEKGRTEIDAFYDEIKQKKNVEISSLAKMFEIDEKTAMSWCETLERGKLIKIEYPRFREPRATIPN